MATRRTRSVAAALLAAATVAAAGCAVPEEGDSGGGGGGLEIQYCEQDHRGGLNEARCYDNPDGSR